MALSISEQDRKELEEIAGQATPYSDEDPELHDWGADADMDRMMATIAQKLLDGKLK